MNTGCKSLQNIRKLLLHKHLSQTVTEVHHEQHYTPNCQFCLFSSGRHRIFEGRGGGGKKGGHQLYVHFREHLKMCPPLDGCPRWHIMMFSPLEGHPRWHFMLFSPLEGHPRWRYKMFSPLEGHPRWHFKMFSPLEGHPR